MKLIMLGLLSALVGSPSMGPGIERLYFIDGVDRHDGMSASISTQRGSVRVASDLMRLSDCRVEGLSVCFTSAYMTFATPAGNATHWRAEGFDFQTVRRTRIAQSKGGIEIIQSAQPHGNFVFFVSAQHGLVGWRLSSNAPSGPRDDWFAEGFGTLAHAVN